MTETPDTTPEAGQLTPEEEAALLVDTSETNGESDLSDPPQDTEPDLGDEGADFPGFDDDEEADQ